MIAAVIYGVSIQDFAGVIPCRVSVEEFLGLARRNPVLPCIGIALISAWLR